MTSQPDTDTATDTAPAISPADAASLFEAFREMVLQHGRMISHESEVLTMGPTDIRALFFVSEIGESTTPKQIADALGLSTGATTSLVDRLADGGTIERAAHPTDRRSVLLHLTPAGRRAVKTVRDVYQSSLAASVAPADVETVTAAFRSLAETLAATIDHDARA